MLSALLLMAALMPAASASVETVAPCVALRALPAQSLDLLDARHTEEGLAALMALAQAGGVGAQDQAWWREQLMEAGEVDGDRLRLWAEQGFERCAARVAPQSRPEQRALCAADLDTLPVILLYRADGVTLAEARRDLREGLDAASAEAARAEAMLRFSYEGAGPRKDAAGPWMRERQQQWVARCLRARGAASRS